MLKEDCIRISTPNANVLIEAPICKAGTRAVNFVVEILGASHSVIVTGEERENTLEVKVWQNVLCQPFVAEAWQRAVQRVDRKHLLATLQQVLRDLT